MVNMVQNSVGSLVPHVSPSKRLPRHPALDLLTHPDPSIHQDDPMLGAPDGSAAKSALAHSRAAMISQMWSTVNKVFDDQCMQLAIQGGDRLVDEFRNAWFDGVKRMQVLNITILWQSAFGQLPGTDEIEAIMLWWTGCLLLGIKRFPLESPLI
jgi:hypothetical protein